MPDSPSSGTPRRFTRVEVVAHGDGFAVALDDALLKTPAGRPLVTLTRGLAALAAAEWRANAKASAMHVTRLLNLAIDLAPEARAAMAAEAARYAETDLVCHLCDDSPELRAREEAVWEPLRAWAAHELGVALEPTQGVRAAPQPAASLEAARARALALDDVGLAALAHAATLLGSVVLAFALLEGRLGASAALAASRIDEAHQEERWGVDAEAAARTARLADELSAVERVMRARAEGAA